jgi:hypothetical protein
MHTELEHLIVMLGGKEDAGGYVVESGELSVFDVMYKDRRSLDGLVCLQYMIPRIEMML